MVKRFTESQQQQLKNHVSSFLLHQNPNQLFYFFAFKETPSKTSILSSEYHSKEQQKTSSYSNHDEKTPCRHGSKYRDQNLPQHCSQYSHPSERRPRSSADHDQRKPCPLGIGCCD